jgi:hypothetical protein
LRNAVQLQRLALAADADAGAFFLMVIVWLLPISKCPAIIPLPAYAGN